MYFNIITIFPEMFRSITHYGITGKAVQKKIIHINFFNPRDFTRKKYKSVDDRPYGGGPGMVMSVEPLHIAIQKAKKTLEKTTVIYLSPQGRRFQQKNISYFIEKKNIILICGRYKGVDQRIIDNHIDEEWSIGDYILTGGELAAMNIIDAITRLIPGVIRKKKSIEEDSFNNRLLDYPHYTRPEMIDGMKVPQVLLSGNHNNIYLWRLKESLRNTWIKRPDILKTVCLTEEEKCLLHELKKNVDNKKKK